MSKKTFSRLLGIASIITLVLSSCNAAGTQTATKIQSAPTQMDPVIGSTQPMPEEVSDFDPISAEPDTPAPIQPTPTPIVETRLPPEKWREWPVIPEMTGREKDIYQYGLRLGNDPEKFSKVGDCQSIKDVLMGIYDLPDRYSLRENDAYLQETIEHFSGSFNRDGQAVRGGYNTAAVLSPIWADPEACQPGESPIECEYRLHKPGFVIISLEVWWEGRTVERYEEYMRQIIEFHIDNGVVPILSTKADNVEGDHRINLATAKLAYDYHIPLWNFWLAVQPMPNHGIDPERDGFHLSYDAWTVRSYTALQALDAVWREVRDQEAALEMSLPTPEDVGEFLPITIVPEPVDSPAPSANERLIFSLAQRLGDETRSAGVYTFDLADKTLYQILETGYQLEDVDQTGTAMLVSRGRELFIKDLNGEIQAITDNLAVTARNASAFWMPDNSRIVLLTGNNNDRTLSLFNPQTDTWQDIANGDITGIIKPARDKALYWVQGQCDSSAECEDETIWTNRDEKIDIFAEQKDVIFSSSGEIYAWIEKKDQTPIILYTRSADQTAQQFLYLPGNRSIDMVWSPHSDQLAVLTVIRSEYSGKSSDARIFVVNANNMSHQEYLAVPGLHPGLTWHQDTGSLLLTSTLPIETGYQIHFRQLNLASKFVETLDEHLTIQSEGFITINQLFWFVP